MRLARAMAAESREVSSRRRPAGGQDVCQGEESRAPCDDARARHAGGRAPPGCSGDHGHDCRCNASQLWMEYGPAPAPAQKNAGTDGVPERAIRELEEMEAIVEKELNWGFRIERDDTWEMRRRVEYRTVRVMSAVFLIALRDEFGSGKNGPCVLIKNWPTSGLPSMKAA